MVLPGHAASWAISLCLQGPLIRHSSGQSHRPCQLPLASPTIPIPCPLYPFTPPDWCSLSHFFFSSNLKLNVIPTTEPRPLLYLCISQGSPGKQKERKRRKSKKREGSGREERERKRTTDLFYVIGSLGSHDCGHWQVQNLQGESQAADPGPSGLQFASKGHPLENPLLFGCFLFLFYTGVQLIKWGPPILWRAICCPPSPLIRMLISSPQILTETFRIMSDHISGHRGSAKLTYEISHCIYLPLLLLSGSFSFSLISLSSQSALLLCLPCAVLPPPSQPPLPSSDPHCPLSLPHVPQDWGKVMSV